MLLGAEVKLNAPWARRIGKTTDWDQTSESAAYLWLGELVFWTGFVREFGPGAR